MIDVIRDVLALIGGAGIIILGLSKWVGKIWQERLKERERLKTERSLEMHRQQLGSVRIKTDKYAAAQFEIYRELWTSLDGLRDAGDALWKEVTYKNIDRFADQLRATQSFVNQSEIFFEDKELKELRRLFAAFGRFSIGKSTLREIRSSARLGEQMGESILNRRVREQIQKNRKYKNTYAQLLEKIRMSFRNRLSKLDAAA